MQCWDMSLLCCALLSSPAGPDWPGWPWGRAWLQPSWGSATPCPWLCAISSEPPCGLCLSWLGVPLHPRALSGVARRCLGSVRYFSILPCHHHPYHSWRPRMVSPALSPRADRLQAAPWESCFDLGSFEEQGWRTSDGFIQRGRISHVLCLKTHLLLCWSGGLTQPNRGNWPREPR